ncbi:Hypothetical protein POVN_LOCUS43 [uncultured virus]|nr:Hypothetical protein POVN_LOCUS43 [uncultured virus]
MSDVKQVQSALEAKAKALKRSVHHIKRAIRINARSISLFGHLPPGQDKNRHIAQLRAEQERLKAEQKSTQKKLEDANDACFLNEEKLEFAASHENTRLQRHIYREQKRAVAQTIPAEAATPTPVQYSAEIVAVYAVAAIHAVAAS